MPWDDVSVPLKQSVELRDAMRKEGAYVRLFEYEHTEHSISPPRYRIDMLARLGAFLDIYLGTSAREPARRGKRNR